MNGGFGSGQQNPTVFGIAGFVASPSGATTGMPTIGMPGMGGMSAADMRCGMGAGMLGGMGGMDPANPMLPLMLAQQCQVMAMEQLMSAMMMMMMSLMRGQMGNLPNGMQVPGLRGGTGGGAGAGNPAGGASGASSTGAAGGAEKIQPGGEGQPAVMRQGKRIGANLASAFDRMVEAAKKDGVELRIVSGYRTHAEQQALWNKNPNPRMVARPGTSNHEKGNAIDFANTPGAYAWLKANAAKFGLHNYPVEPWHYSVDGH